MHRDRISSFSTVSCMDIKGKRKPGINQHSTNLYEIRDVQEQDIELTGTSPGVDCHGACQKLPWAKQTGGKNRAAIGRGAGAHWARWCSGEQMRLLLLLSSQLPLSEEIVPTR